jgi:hypothetical protein
VRPAKRASNPSTAHSCARPHSNIRSARVRRLRSPFSLRQPPARIVCDDALDDGDEGSRVEGFTLKDRDRARGLIVVAACNDALRVRHETAVVEKDVDVVPDVLVGWAPSRARAVIRRARSLRAVGAGDRVPTSSRSNQDVLAWHESRRHPAPDCRSLVQNTGLPRSPRVRAFSSPEPQERPSGRDKCPRFF